MSEYNTAADIAEGLDGRRSGDGWTALCPAHDDKHPSLTISEGKNGKPLLYCHTGCSQDAVIDALRARGLWAPEARTHTSANGRPAPRSKDRRSEWTYTHENGNTAFVVHRIDYADKRPKDIWQSPKGYKGKRPLFDLPDLLKDGARPILIVEGEKAADDARGYFPLQPYDVTSAAMGSGKAKLTDWSPLKGRDVTIWPDNDEPGANHAKDVAELCREAGAKSIRVVDVSSLPPKWDLADPIPEGDVRRMLGAAAETAGGSPGIKIKWTDDLMDAASPIPWIWNGWLPKSALTLLAGPKGLGKSTLALHVAGMVTRGECPGQNGKPGLVLYWSGEDDERIIASKAQAARMGPGFGLIGHFFDRPFDPATDLRLLIDQVEELNPDLLVIDPIIRVLAGKNNAAEDVRRSLDPLASYAEERGITILGVGHFAKGSGDRAVVDRFLGSQAWTARARMVWGVVQAGDTRLFGKAATNLADQRGAYEYTIDEAWIDTRYHGRVQTTTVALGDPLVDETLDDAERRLTEEHAASAVGERYSDDAIEARQWLREHGGCVTSDEWSDYCQTNGWGSNNSRTCRAIGKALELRTTLRGRPPDRVTYRHLPGADVPK